MNHTQGAQKWWAEKKGVWQQIFMVLASFMAVLSFSVQLDIETALPRALGGYNALYVALFLAFYFLYQKALQVVPTKRVWRFTLIAALLLAFTSVLGSVIMETQTLSSMFLNGNQAAKYLILLLGRWALYCVVLALVFSALLRHSHEWSVPRPIRPGRLPFFALWGGLMLCWVGYLFILYPGVFSEDSLHQVAQVLGKAPLKNDNPLAHTMLFGLFAHLGLWMGNINWGAMLYSLFQMLAMSGIFALCLDYLRKKGVPRRLWIPAACVWAFFPVYPVYALTMWKDILLGGSVVLLGLQVIAMVENREGYFARRWHIFALLGTGLLMSLIKTNGILVFLPTMLLLLPFLPKLRKWLALCAVLITGLFLLVQGPLYSALGVESGSAREVLSLPIQQVSRIMLLHEEEIDPFDVDTYYAFFPMNGHEELEERFDWTYCDPIKEQFDEWVFEHSKGAFFQLWGKLILQYPADAFDQLLCNTLGYWYPEMKQWIFYLSTRPNDFGIEDASVGGMPEVREFLLHRGFPALWWIPVVSMLMSIGFSFVLLFLAFLLVMLKRRYLSLLAFLPSIFMWINALLSPVNCEFRYAFGMIASVPLLLPWILALASKASIGQPEPQK